MLRVLLTVASVLTTSRLFGQDPRVGLSAGMTNAGVASSNMKLISNTPRPAPLAPGSGPAIPAGMPPVIGDILYANSDFAFRNNLLFMGNFRGFQIYDVANAAAPKLVTAFVCPGGQGDVSIHGNLLFMSVEMPNGRTDCADVPFSMDPAPTRFEGVRIFDITNVAKPKQVAFVQTCRGSHTHTLVPDGKDRASVYLYVSGVSEVRPATEVPGCSGGMPDKDPNTAYFRIEVVKVPLKRPQDAKVVNSPRLFADSAGNIAGLWMGGSHGEGTQNTARTDQCHDITVYPEMGLAAGACSGNGILLDISDPSKPRRIDQVMDPNFSYWHSANFNNDATKLLFTDEWGSGMAPRCQSTDKKEWGADAIFTLSNRKLKLGGYYKLPAAQSDKENCVAHNGSLIPVPGRDIMVQAWYQGGISIFDFTDAKSPVEIGYFDRGPYDAGVLRLGGHWSAYWYNGRIFASEIGRGLDIIEVTPSEALTQNELDAAKLVTWGEYNPQTQLRATWPSHPSVALALIDQLRRGGNLPVEQLNQAAQQIDAALKQSLATRRAGYQQLAMAVATWRAATTNQTDLKRIDWLAKTLSDLAK